MSSTLHENAVDCGEVLAFKDSAGRLSYVKKSEIDKETEELYSNPGALRVLNDSTEDYADGRFVDFTF